jgi:hypothetical protein
MSRFRGTAVPLALGLACAAGSLAIAGEFRSRGVPVTSQTIELDDVHFAWPRGAPVLAISPESGLSCCS